jgi:hypothetical protein
MDHIQDFPHGNDSNPGYGILGYLTRNSMKSLVVDDMIRKIPSGINR